MEERDFKINQLQDSKWKCDKILNLTVASLGTER